MQEYSTLALVLDVVPTGEADARVFLFTEKLGRVAARAKSLRKISSKLASHVQPGMISRVRLGEKNGFQLTDALAKKSLPAEGGTPFSKGRREQIQILQMIKEYAQDYHPDAALWELVVSGQLASRQFLKVLGFDPEHARCHNCETPRPSYFIIKNTQYSCRNCVTNTNVAKKNTNDTNSYLHVAKSAHELASLAYH